MKVPNETLDVVRTLNVTSSTTALTPIDSNAPRMRAAPGTSPAKDAAAENTVARTNPTPMTTRAARLLNVLGMNPGRDPIIVFLGAVTGSLLFMLVVLNAGVPLRERLVSRFGDGGEESSSRVRRLYDRYGEVGLATVVPLVLGPTIALSAALVFGVDKGRFARWYAAATIVGFALLTAFWVLVL